MTDYGQPGGKAARLRQAVHEALLRHEELRERGAALGISAPRPLRPLDHDAIRATARAAVLALLRGADA